MAWLRSAGPNNDNNHRIRHYRSENYPTSAFRIHSEQLYEVETSGFVGDAVAPAGRVIKKEDMQVVTSPLDGFSSGKLYIGIECKGCTAEFRIVAELLVAGDAHCQ